ncbi:hypothetical protein [Sinorhizobium sp. BG8]|uniref:hypothetical protein n=1 Tax=Sinorhizobium sp. BG8 TaxID=2613773 RepID=UPI001FEF806C|nr:hypothetical protein [Sinorhizobium sp. BG8]
MASGLRDRTATGEPAACTAGPRHLAADDGKPRNATADQCGLAGKERPGIGMARVREDLPDASLLHNPARIHDRDPITDLCDDAKVVRDHQDRYARCLLKLPHQMQDLGFHGDIKRSGRFVGDEKRGAHQERRGDRHALEHAARKLEGIGIQLAGRVGKADFPQHCNDALPLLVGRLTPVPPEEVRELPAKRMKRTEGGHRVLEYHGGGRAPQRRVILLPLAQHVVAVEEETLAAHTRRGREQSENAVGERRLARAAFADDPHDFGRADLKIDACDRGDETAIGHRKVPHLQNRSRILGRYPCCGSGAGIHQ